MNLRFNLCRAIALGGLLSLPLLVHAEEPKGPGDRGYRHEELHDYYQSYFKGKCPCADGECRPTIVRPNAAVPGTGMEVLIDGQWFAVPEKVLQTRINIPPELLVYPAHVCARPTWVDGAYVPMIECVVFNGAI